MAVSYTKLNIKPVLDEVKTIQWNNEIIIEVKQYLAHARKLEVLTDIINASNDDNGFYNEARIEFNTIMQLIFAYTNIKFTEKQLEDSQKIYDALWTSGLMKQIFELIPMQEQEWFRDKIHRTIDNIYAYRNSVYGILDALKTDYSELGLDIEQLRQALANNEGIEFLREVTEKMV